jgi:mannose-6-phosphate isomerase
LQVWSKSCKKHFAFIFQGYPEILQGVPLNKNVCRYTPPFDEFEVDRCSLLPDGTVTFTSLPGPSIFLVLSGTASIAIDTLEGLETFSEGDVFFVSANTETNITNAAAAPLVFFRAGVNERFFD